MQATTLQDISNRLDVLTAAVLSNKNVLTVEEAAALVEAFKTEQPKNIRGAYCRAALTAKAELVRLLNAQENSAVIIEATKEARRFEDVIEELWRFADEW